MAESKEATVNVQTPSLSTDGEPTVHGHDGGHQLHFAQRGADVDLAKVGVNTDSDIDGYDAERMRARSALTTEEEKKLMRRVDIRMMILCSLIFLIKNLDSANISNVRIMNAGTPRNIMTQLKLTSDEYSLLTVLYYVPYIVLEAPSNLLLKRASLCRRALRCCAMCPSATRAASMPRGSCWASLRPACSRASSCR